MKDGLYNKAVGLPKGFEVSPVLCLRYSVHARERAIENRVELPKHFLPRVAEVVEVEVVNGAVHKIVARQSFNATHDVCFVLLMAEKLVKTVWVNLRSDRHFTLDKGRFTRP